MSHLEQTREVVEAASRRRAHLSVRAVLDALLHLGLGVTRAATRLRARLDAKGGAHDTGAHDTGAHDTEQQTQNAA